MTVEVSLCPELTGLRIGVVEFANVQVRPSSVELRTWSDEVAQRAARESEFEVHTELRQQIRQMLRHGQFKASGRSKPAQEYLLRCAVQDGKLPTINAPVDILNTVSLGCGLPISLLSIAKCSKRLHVRRGRPGESYVFNAAGQELNVVDLVVVCDQNQSPDRPVGSPIKDSMAGKIEIGDHCLVAMVYAPHTASERLLDATTLLIEQFDKYGVGSGVAIR